MDFRTGSVVDRDDPCIVLAGWPVAPIGDFKRPKSKRQIASIGAALRPIQPPLIEHLFSAHLFGMESFFI